MIDIGKSLARLVIVIKGLGQRGEVSSCTVELPLKSGGYILVEVRVIEVEKPRLRICEGSDED